MVASPALPADNRASAERFIARLRVVVAVYCLALSSFGGDDFGYYRRGGFVVAGAFFVYAAGAAFIVGRAARTGDIGAWVPYVTTALDTALILAFAAVTGASHSPLVPLAVLDVMAAAIRFDLRRALAVTGIATAGLVAVIALVPEPALSGAQRARSAAWWTAHLIAGAVMAGMLSDLVDQARRRRAEAEAESAALERRSAEERRLRERLETIDQARKDFLHAIAHDFRTPIASMEALARALTRDAVTVTPSERDAILELMQSHARHLGSMLAEVREVAVTESLSIERQLDLVDVYVPELIWTAGAAAAIPHDRLVLDIEAGLNVLRTDSHKLQRIISNLLENSFRHSPPDSPLEVRIRRTTGRLRGGVGEQAQMVELAILDRGSGIPPELASRAFEKFAGFGPNRSWGLGMWIVSQFVWTLGGSVGVEPRDGGGLVVWARFPESSMVPGGVFGLPGTAEVVDVEVDVDDIGLDGLEDDDEFVEL
ncbi:MAG TPA: ATP-binding protein [Acidimicrobiia bacterium]|nr:ATP-binding protein [Acidimicrobiia bacterium]